MIQDNRYYDPSHISFNSIRTNRCPKCKTGYMKVDKSIILTSYPPKYKEYVLIVTMLIVFMLTK